MTSPMSDADLLVFLEETFGGLNETDFLTGPGFSEQDLDIDPVFAKPWGDVLQDAMTDLGIPDTRLLRDWAIETLQRRPGLQSLMAVYGVAICEAADSSGFVIGVAAIDLRPGEETIAGLYTGCQLGVCDAWRRRGIGSHLVKERFLMDGALPTWSLDSPAYSPGGRAAHLSGYNLLHGELTRLRQPDTDCRFSL